MIDDIPTLYAHIDADGRILGHGHAFGLDAFRQVVPEGAICVVRPEHVTAYQPWRLVDGEWALEPPPS